MAGEVKKSLGSNSKGEALASPQELAEALKASQETIKLLEQKLADKDKEKSSVDALTEALTKLVEQPKQEVRTISDIDNLNRTNDFKTQRNYVDGRSLMEAQEVAQEFRSEPKLPISIPKAMGDYFGQTLTVTVNGVRVSIPCDGKTYFINKTHWEHAKERIARVDALNSNQELTNIVMEA